jgi:hypothetical protein
VHYKESHTCQCAVPRPVQLATRKGAARTHCAHCGKPLPLRLTTRWPSEAA